MLITTCAHCNARFRVTPQQLNARQGQVRCGRCSQVFNGFQILERFPDDDTGGRLLAEYERRRIAEPAPPAGTPSAAPAAGEPLDLPIFEAEPPASPPPPQAAAPAPAHDFEPQPVQASVPPPPRRRRWLRHEPDITLEMDPPEPPARAWRFGVVLAALVLALEAAYAWRGPIAQRYPVLRPALEAACAYVGCTVPYSRDESLLKLEDSELLEVPGKPNEIALGARVRNLASVAQEYPYLELTLTDLTGQAAVRRVLRPTDYMGRPLGYGEVIPAGVEVALQLRLETPRIKATGYQLLVFYP